MAFLEACAINKPPLFLADSGIVRIRWKEFEPGMSHGGRPPFLFAHVGVFLAYPSAGRQAGPVDRAREVGSEESIQASNSSNRLSGRSNAARISARLSADR